MKAHSVHRAPREPIVLPPPSEASTYVPAGATSAEAAAMLAEAHPVQARKAVRRRRVVAVETPRPAPGPYTLLKDGVLCVSIPLHGEYGEGRRAILDLLAWDRVQLLGGAEWTVRVTGSDPSVVSYRKQARRLTGERDGSATILVLSRFVAGAKDGEVVSFLDGDPFHIRRCNLMVEDRVEHWEAHRATRKPAGLDMTETHRV